MKPYLTLLGFLVLVPLLLSSERQSRIIRSPAAWAALVDGNEWIHEDRSNTRYEKVSIPSQFVREVTHSKLVVAIRSLSPEKWCIELTPNEATFLTGGSWQSTEGRRPYLVRAAFFPRGEDFEVSRLGSDRLEVENYGVGHNEPEALLKAALVVDLDFEPVEVYVVARIVG